MELGQFHHVDEKCLESVDYEDNVERKGFIKSSVLNLPVLCANRRFHHLSLKVLISINNSIFFRMIFLHVIQMELAKAG